MTPSQVERWALQAVEAQREGRDEDSRVEFKRQLPEDARKVARRIAGHANAARGEPILWVVGVDKTGELTTGKLPAGADPANYWPRVWCEFDDVRPELVDVYVEFDGVQLLALGFGCDRVPYVVRTGLDAPNLEVPWRDGTRVVTATRSQVLRSMLPLTRLPGVEVIRAPSSDEGLAVMFFVIPPTRDVLVLPMRHCILQCGEHEVRAHEIHPNTSDVTAKDHPAVKLANKCLYFEAPGEAVLRWRVARYSPPQPCKVRLRFEPGAVDVVVTQGLPNR